MQFVLKFPIRLVRVIPTMRADGEVHIVINVATMLLVLRLLRDHHRSLDILHAAVAQR